MTAITGSESMWQSIGAPSSATLALINSSPTLVQELNNYQAAIGQGKALPFSLNPAQPDVLQTVPNSSGQLQIDFGSARVSNYTDTNNNLITDLSYELGHFENYSNDQALYQSLSLSPNDPSYSQLAAIAGVKGEQESAANNYVVQQEIQSATGTKINLNGDGPNNANGVLQATFDSAYASDKANGVAPADDYGMFVESVSGIMGNFPALPDGNNGMYTFAQYYAANAIQVDHYFNPTALQLNFGLQGASSDNIKDISTNYDPNTGALSESTLTFSSGEQEKFSFSNSQISSAQYTDQSGNVVSTITYIHNADGSYSATTTDTTGAVVSTQQFSSDGSSEIDTVDNVSTPADINVSGMTLTTNANVINVNGENYDTTILNGGHVINAQAGDSFQLTGAGYDVNLTTTGAASTVTFEANSGGTVNGTGNTVDLGTNDTITTSGNTINVNQGDQATINGSNNDLTVSGPGVNATLSGSSNTISANGIASGSTFTLESTGTNADTLNLAGATDVTALLGNATTVVDLGINNSLTVNSENGGGTVVGNAGDNVTVSGSNVTVDATAGQYNLTGIGDTANVSNSTISLASSDQTSVTGSDNTVTTGTNDRVSLIGNGDVATAGTGSTITINGQSDSINVSGSAIDLASNSQASITGTSDNVTATSGDVIDLNNATITLTADSSVTIDGSNDTIIGSSDDSISILGQGDTIDASGGDIYGQTGDTFTVNGSSDLITNGGNSSVSIDGNNDNVAYDGPDSSITIAGTGETLDTSSSDIYGQAGDSFTVNGSGDLITNGGNSTTSLNGNNDTVAYDGPNSSIQVAGTGETLDTSGSDIYGQTGDTFTVNGSSDLITNGGNSSVSIDGNNDNVAYDGPDSSITIAGTGETLDTSSSDIYGQAGDSFTVNGSSDLITNGGNSTTSLNGNNDTVAYDGPSSSIHVAGTGETLDTSGSDIYGQTGDTFTVNGSSDLVTNGNDSSAWLNGNNDTVAYDGSNSAVVLNGIGETVDLVNNSGTTVNFDANAQGTVEGAGDTIGVLGSGDSVTASGDTFYFSGGGDTTKITGNSDTVNAAGDSIENISGTGDVVHLVSNSDSTVNFGGDSDDTVTGSGDTIGIYGPGDTITASNDAIVSGGSGDVATIDGSGDTGSGDDGDGGDSGDPGDGDPDPGSYGGYYGFAGKQSVINAALGGNINSIAQYDLSTGNRAGAAAAESGLRQAQAMAAATPTFGTGKVVASGNSWTVGETITWSLASDIGSQYDAEVEQAFASWSAASGITFKEAVSASDANIQIGFSDLDTSTTGVVGYTTVQATGGQISDAVIQLENPEQEALVPGISGQPTYSGTDATLTQVLLHEIGHALGLADDSDKNSIMYYELTSNNQNLDGTDVAGIQSIYGISGGTSSTPQPITAMTKGGTAEHQLHQLIAGMASFSPQAAGNASQNHEDLHQHMILAASAN
ncbi:matrixin family metalloprotease [Paraburkholderia dipogonis]|uniref:Matrixin family metalloprotease n=1 Tax=Paraburkholderia dipogonis TaxID=1211383 RepID=A0A4Y8MJM4_9BURK|nr:matrixin family metalloprotease [Paraburkholderia dipogonis]TFE37670.1 matrixin family metalloprotease [Paraburkholderia dipogonis]